ncbi:MAG: MFS transporter [Bariatricus sp.]
METKEKTKEAKKEKLSLLERLGYGLGDLAGVGNSLLAAFLTMFYTDSVGMAAGAVGTMFFISKLFDGITDLIAGSIVDKTKTKWGKARPWLLWLSVPTGLALALVFWVPVDASETTKLIYAFLTYNLFSSVLYTMVGVAKTSLMPLITQDGEQRGTLAIFASIFGLGGTLLGFSVTFPFVNALGGNIMAWRIVFIVYGILVTLGLLASFAFTRERVEAVEDVVSHANGKEKESVSFKEGVTLFVKNKYFLFALFVTVLVQLNLNMNSGSQTFFYTYVMGDQMLMASLNLVNLIPTIIGIVFLSGPMLKLFGKKNCVYIGAIGQILGFALKGFAGAITSVPLLIVGTIVGSLASAPMSIPIQILSADAVDYGEYLFNKRIEGIGSAIGSFSNKLSAGLAAAIVGWALQLTGYVANEAQSAFTNFAITGLFAWGPALLLVVILIVFKLVYHYDEEEPKVMAELNRRKGEIQ